MADHAEMEAGRAYQGRDRQIPRPRHAEQHEARPLPFSGSRPRTHQPGEVDRHADPRLLVEGGFSSNLEHTRTAIARASSSRASLDAWYANTNQTESDLGGWRRAAQAQNTQSPARYNWQAAMSYVRPSTSKTGVPQYQRGTFFHTVDANGDLYQVYRSASTGIPHSVPDSVVIRNTPLASIR